MQRHFPGRTPDDPTVSNWLNAIEHEYELIAYLVDDTLTDWTRKAIRQADQVLIVVSGTAPDELNPVEAFALEHAPARPPPAACACTSTAPAGSKAPPPGSSNATWRCTTTCRWRTISISRACIAF